MKAKKSSLIKLLFPPIWLILILIGFSSATLAAIFIKGLEETPVAYVIYVISFYTLTVLCVSCSLELPGYYRRLKQKVYDNKFGNRYMTDPAYKTYINLWRSLCINFLYAAFNLVSGIYYGTAWFILFAAYYFIMAVMRFLLLRYATKNGIGKNRLKELRRSRLCAVILLTVNLTLSGAVLMMIYFDRGFDYYGVLIYVMAMYTFYITTAAIINMIRYKKYNSPIMSIAKSINLAAALVTVLSLETAMLSQFGGELSLEIRRKMIIATGAGISAVVLCISAYTVWKTSREIIKLKYNNF